MPAQNPTPASPPAIILASSSPRRRELLLGLGLEFRVMSPDVEEVPRPGERPADFARRAACDKARAVVTRAAGKKPFIVIAADTIVVADGCILGKPADADDAARMLGRLSGRGHEVLTGLCVCRVGPQGTAEEHALTVRTEVEFKPLSAAEIAAYVATGEPLDKAGAYGIQGGANYMVRAIRGSYTNVVGLPLAELKDLLNKFEEN